MPNLTAIRKARGARASSTRVNFQLMAKKTIRAAITMTILSNKEKLLHLINWKMVSISPVHLLIRSPDRLDIRKLRLCRASFLNRALRSSKVAA